MGLAAIRPATLGNAGAFIGRCYGERDDTHASASKFAPPALLATRSAPAPTENPPLQNRLDPAAFVVIDQLAERRFVKLMEHIAEFVRQMSSRGRKGLLEPAAASGMAVGGRRLAANGFSSFQAKAMSICEASASR
jgi:hypothetical protein